MTSPHAPYPSTMRVQRFLARAGVASRRGSETLMSAGRVAVNGVVVTELGSKLDPEKDTVTVDGHEVHLHDEHCYLVLHKPSGYLTTMSDPYGRPCVASLVPTDRFPGLFPVGRLDEDTTGLLLFTSDGDAGQRMLHPSRHVWKRYLALVQGKLKSSALAALREGLLLGDGPTQPAEAELLSPSSQDAQALIPHGLPQGSSLVSLRIHEGRKHQVKRMLKAVGHEVLQLHRSEFGPLKLGGVAPGEWRLCTSAEIQAIQNLCSSEQESAAAQRR